MAKPSPELIALLFSISSSCVEIRGGTGTQLRSRSRGGGAARLRSRSRTEGVSLVEVSQRRSGDNDESENRFDQRETVENDDANQTEDIEEGSEDYYWIHISGLPPRCSYMQIKKITRDLLGHERDLVTGEINNDTALICMASQEAADSFAALLRGHEIAPGCVLAAEVYSQAERMARFGESRRTKIMGSKENSGDKKQQTESLHRGASRLLLVSKVQKYLGIVGQG
eukprot:TRINITY_DN31281_c0_g1_i2.p1 TRINITY_DN31281_c0_g1~~TRINITY_DN31281_c0_g1_i2.p1  ORF type:complete len:227 (-),score=38.77 TRINITY_DN31281_c0_g1_i2:327-1007(-)